MKYATNLFVRKKPPSFHKWMEQRPRQAYEDFSLRAKTALFFFIPILGAIAAASAGWKGIAFWLCLIFVVSVGLAIGGRSRGVAREFFPGWICLFAPLWIIERSASTYWALYWHFIYGGYPFGDKILSKGIGRDWISGGRVAADAAARQSD